MWLNQELSQKLSGGSAGQSRGNCPLTGALTPHFSSGLSCWGIGEARLGDGVATPF
jgi:hypothetical protein